MLTKRDEDRLQGVHPDLIKVLHDVAATQEASGFPIFVVQGVRTAAQQAVLYSQGRSRPGKIVTMKDGIVHKSNHQLHADGFGHAVDMAFVPTAERRDPFDEGWPWEEYGQRIENFGLQWGGRWSHPHDSPHAEMPAA